MLQDSAGNRCVKRPEGQPVRWTSTKHGRMSRGLLFYVRSLSPPYGTYTYVPPLPPFIAKPFSSSYRSASAIRVTVKTVKVSNWETWKNYTPGCSHYFCASAIINSFCWSVCVYCELSRGCRPWQEQRQKVKEPQKRNYSLLPGTTTSMHIRTLYLCLSLFPLTHRPLFICEGRSNS